MGVDSTRQEKIYIVQWMNVVLFFNGSHSNSKGIRSERDSPF